MSFDKFVKKPKKTVRASDIHPEHNKPAEFGKDTTSAEYYELKLAQFITKHANTLTLAEAKAYFVLQYFKRNLGSPFPLTAWTISLWAKTPIATAHSIMEKLTAQFPANVRKTLYGIDRVDAWEYVS